MVTIAVTSIDGWTKNYRANEWSEKEELHFINFAEMVCGTLTVLDADGKEIFYWEY